MPAMLSCTRFAINGESSLLTLRPSSTFISVCLFLPDSDGPSPDTPRLLNYMVENDLKATFFVVGSRAISRPQMLQYEYMAGNQISVHTWAHPPLTTRTNEEVVAELGWSKEAIRQIVSLVLLLVVESRIKTPFPKTYINPAFAD